MVNLQYINIILLHTEGTDWLIDYKYWSFLRFNGWCRIWDKLKKIYLFFWIIVRLDCDKIGAEPKNHILFKSLFKGRILIIDSSSMLWSEFVTITFKFRNVWFCIWRVVLMSPQKLFENDLMREYMKAIFLFNHKHIDACSNNLTFTTKMSRK